MAVRELYRLAAVALATARRNRASGLAVAVAGLLAFSAPSPAQEIPNLGAPMIPNSTGGGGGTPGGSTTQVQFNNAGAFGGTSAITTDGTNATIATGTGTVTIGAGSAITSSGAGGALGTGAFAAAYVLTVNTSTIASGADLGVLFQDGASPTGVLQQNAAFTFTKGTGVLGVTGATLTSGPLSFAGNISAATWGTAGLRIKGVAATFTDTSGTGTVAAGYTDVLGGNTIAATTPTRTFTNYYTLFLNDPVVGSNVVMTNKWSLGTQGALSVGGNLQVGAQQFISGGTGTITPFTIPATVSITGSLAVVGGAVTHLLQDNWTEKNVIAAWNQSSTGYSAYTFLRSDNGSECGAIGYGNHPSGGPIWSRSNYIESSNCYGTGGGVATFTNGSAVIGLTNSFTLNTAIVCSNSGGALPTNFAANTLYYVSLTGLSSTQFELTTAPSGVTPIVAGSAGTGTQTCATAPVPLLFALTGTMGGVFNSYIRQWFDPLGDVNIGSTAGSDAITAPTLVVSKDGTLHISNPSTKIGFLSNNMLFVSQNNVSTSGFAFSNANGANTNFMFPYANGGWKWGGPDIAAPVAQSFQAQSVLAGTSNTAGANWTLIGSLSSGSGASGDIIFQTGGTGAGATAQNTATTALTIKGATQQTNFAGIVNTNSGFTPTAGSGAASVAGNDQRFVVTAGTAQTSITVNFGHTWTAAPVCTLASNSTASVVDITSISTTAITFGASVALTGSLLYALCFGG